MRWAGAGVAVSVDGHEFSVPELPDAVFSKAALHLLNREPGQPSSTAVAGAPWASFQPCSPSEAAHSYPA